MPLIEYRGSGKTDIEIGDMSAIWDHEWETKNDPAALQIKDTDEHCRWIREYLPKSGRVLEAGCGLARWVAFLAGRGYEAYGLDFSPIAIKRSLSIWPDLNLVQGDLRKMSFETDFFDAMVSFGAIEHDPDGPEAALREMWRVTAPGGILYCTVPCMNILRRMGTMPLQNLIVCNKTIRKLTGRNADVAFYEFVYTPKEYRSILTGVNWEVLALIPLGPRLDFFNPPENSLRGRLLHRVHSCLPWLTPHMMAAVCRKPIAGS
jgi:SAM-dependent methyltransferase